MPILHKRNTTSGVIPTTSSLLVGELAINVADGKLFGRRSGSAGDYVVSYLGSGITNTGSYIISGNFTVTGSISNISGGITGSLFGTASYALTIPTNAVNFATSSTTTQVVVSSSFAFPYSIVSASITTTGNPVFVMASGDANPLAAGGWGVIQLYRGTTAIGYSLNYEGSGANENSPYGIHAIDRPSAGTYTYFLKATNVTVGQHQFGETGPPFLSVYEMGVASTAIAQATTGSNTFVGNQTISGSIILSGLPSASVVDRSDSVASYANSATVDFPNFSGMILFNNQSASGMVTMVLCGGAAVSKIGASGTGIGTGSFSYVSGINGYRWTNDTGGAINATFAAIKMRNSA